MAWFFEDQADVYSEIILDHLNQNTAWVPALWSYEVANVLLSYGRRKKISPAGTLEFFRLLRDLPIKVVYPMAWNPGGEPWELWLSLGREYRLSAYDAAYLELAMSRGLPIATRDQDLRKAARRAGVKIFEGA